ncbi:maleylpyruvate isomerase family mycothiol-dependent enzyme [Saccharopolyspora sp. K220]|uniref:maleylpyruvate isomerase family mycothiol-dependent enzyme n=1 Tax=Saccharopolyspora soli TaxID=2926618 RepID=UPI001F59801C|nr:maleylpyruvate isomerase family mycothiol-dependent enzyme [Saccharopolyspora soli]MCI2420871.1 maleylpyruvate isomerase family mycothiol-dependent enzyme [Saccharopolyspora soli]
MKDTDWLAALHASSQRLAELVADLTDDQLATPSYASGWSIAQVLSHLGSAAEIGTLLVQRGIDGDPTGPAKRDTTPVWQRWDAMSGAEQREAWRAADAKHLALLDSADIATVQIPYFAGQLSVAVYAGYRLSEQSLHGWDVEVALDPSATVPAAEVELLWQRLDRVATRFRDAETLARLKPGQVALQLSEPRRTLCLDLGGELHIVPCEPGDPTATVWGTAEAVLRLVYGRNRVEDGVTAVGAVTVDDLRSLFPGF